MNTLLNVMLVVSVMILLAIYYKSAFKSISKDPLKLLKYVSIWLIVILSLSLMINEFYIKKQKNKIIIQDEDFLEVKTFKLPELSQYLNTNN